MTDILCVLQYSNKGVASFFIVFHDFFISYGVGGSWRKLEIFGKGEEDLRVLMLEDSTDPENGIIIFPCVRRLAR